MLSALAAYLPQDRRRALAEGVDLPEQTAGTALFADISSFTPLTEALDRALGARRGAEELTRQINAVYDALIAEVDRYGGSVIGFAGDAITCWFDESVVSGPSPRGYPVADEHGQRTTDNGPRTALRATNCALAMQTAMRQFAVLPLPDGSTTALGLKVALASGAARRFVVGDPSIQLLDVLTGAPLARTAAGEHLAAKGEVLIDAATATALGDQIQIAAWRVDEESGERFTVVSTNHAQPPTTEPVSRSAPHPLSRSAEQLRAWLLPAVFERHTAGLGDFLTELRPAVALFLRFAGIDYQGNLEARSQLDSFIRRVQAILARYDGTLLQLTIGDKGSYLYAAFGAPTSHEDDARRAARTALEWLALPDELDFLAPLQIGISRGVLRAGAYGGSTRQTYGVLGDEVNLAARLMQRAAPGEALVSGRVQAALAAEFALEPLEPIPLKGMPEPLPVFRLAGTRQQAVRLSEPAYTLPMVGRKAELNLIADKLERALTGQGQVVGIIAEAGMGKSRLVAEVIRLARRKGLRGFGGACQSYGTNTAYLVWEPIWRAFFDLDPAMPLRRQIRTLEGAVEDWAPERIEALPLLGQLLGLNLVENDFTKHLEPQHRKSALEALLLDCLSAAAHEAAGDGTGLLFVLEDLHWIDALSYELLERVAQAAQELPILVVLAYRPPELLRLQAPRIEALEHFTRVELGPLTDVEAAQAIRAKLAQLLPERKGAATPTLIGRITERAQGNPFYVEELLNYLRDRGMDPQDTGAFEALDLPASLHTLILSRIDQLSAQQQAELKVASVIGRLFRVAHLHGAYPMLGAVEPLKADLEELASLELTPLDTPEPELAYLFKHIVTQEVAYQSLTAQARAGLHEQLAAYLERLVGDDIERYVDLLAYHYERSDNLAKKREYLRRAGAAAAGRFANDAAIDYLSRALALAPEDDAAERYTLLLAREEVLQLLGEQTARRADIESLLQLAHAFGEDRRLAQAYWTKSNFFAESGDQRAVLLTIEQAISAAARAGDVARLAESLALKAMALIRLGEVAAGQTAIEQALAATEQVTSDFTRTQVLKFAWNYYYNAGDIAKSLHYGKLALEVAQRSADRSNETVIRSNLGLNYAMLGMYEPARLALEESLRLGAAIGYRRGRGYGLQNLALVHLALGDIGDAEELARQSMPELAETSDSYGLGGSQMYLGFILEQAQRLDEAAGYYREASVAFQEVGAQGLAVEATAGLARCALGHDQLNEAVRNVAKVWDYLTDRKGTGIENLTWVYLTCAAVFTAGQDQAAAKAALEAGYHDLMQRAIKISDPHWRTAFLEKVPDHQTMIRRWQEVQGAGN